MKLEAFPITGTFGAELRGPDLSKTLDGDLAAAILDALHEYRVIFFRNQDITPAQHVAFSAQLGTVVTDYPAYLSRLEGQPEVTVLDGGASDSASFWHSDVSGSEKPPMASILVMKEAPAYGGDTFFADACAAYDALSDRMKVYLEGLRAVHCISGADRTLRRLTPIGMDPPEPEPGRASHPVVRTHSVTRRKILFVNQGNTSHIEGVPAPEGDAVLNHLFEHQHQPEFQLRWRWQMGDIAIWDNRSTQHYAIGDYGDQPRTIHRTTIEGDVPI